jgi:hypothetical protein
MKAIRRRSPAVALGQVGPLFEWSVSGDVPMDESGVLPTRR